MPPRQLSLFSSLPRASTWPHCPDSSHALDRSLSVAPFFTWEEWCLLYVWTDDTILTVHGEWVPHLYGNKLIKTHRIRMACMLWPDQHEVSYFYDKLLPSPSQAFCDVKSACNAFTWFLSFRFNSCFDKAAAGCLLDHWLFETIGMLSRVFSSCSNRIVIYKIVIFET